MIKSNIKSVIVYNNEVPLNLYSNHKVEQTKESLKKKKKINSWNFAAKYSCMLTFLSARSSETWISSR